MAEQIKLTEQEWRSREELRKHWEDFCDADPVPENFADRMEEAGFIEVRKVTRDDLASSFAAERGIEKGGMVWDLTKAGRAVINHKEPSDV